MKIALTVFAILYSILGFTQSTPQNIIRESNPEFYALKNASIYVSPGKKIKGTILVKGDKIEKVGPIVSIPNGAVEIDFSGHTILPAFVELNSDVGVPKAIVNKSAPRPQIKTTKQGAFYWNESIHPEIDANELYVVDSKVSDALIQKGFGFALVHQKDGISRGKAAFIALGCSKEAVLKGEKTSSFFSLHKGVSRQTYPSSQMGAIALLRQTLYDAQWYAEFGKEKNNSLDALNEQLKGSLFFATREKHEILRAQKIANEFDLKFTYLGSGNEYQIAEAIAATNSTVVLPLDFPKAYNVKNPYISRQIPLSELKHWDNAPANAAILKKHGASICLSSNGVDKAVDFWNNLRRAIHHGLTKEEALDALTMSPAKEAGVDNIVGSIEPGKYASFIVYDKDPFKEKTNVIESWMMGKSTIHVARDLRRLRGLYNINADGHKYQLKVTPEGNKGHKGNITYKVAHERTGELQTVSREAFVELMGNDITIQFSLNKGDLIGNISLRGKVTSKFGVMEGDGLLPNGEWVKWSGVKSVKSVISLPQKKEKEVITADTSIHIWHPHMAYGFETLPDSQNIVIKNATLWSNEDDGIIENGSVVIKKGKITYVGSGHYSTPPGSRIIDAQGKHVTSGIIDEHSHIGISKGVNESGQSISAEVSIGDVVNPDDINIYRQLSGGVTASQLLHGSANPVGGQSALIKLKWGHTAEEMLIDNAPKFIKFALGENVKQSNWGDHNTVRFPQTRMGVEQVFYDGFQRARQYKKDRSVSGKRGVDLELEVLNEILESERFISCHSYVQSEINMLMHMADSMGFRINTFTHILEGYKLADKMVEHGAGGSTFSDWWAYKYEVNDAIPYNAKLMHDQGVVVAINSDDAEMGRRLNQEAAKGVKYGGMSEEDAWKMVTLNPAKLLHLDHRMGSLKKGKDADVVIWTDNPLSINAKVEYTIVDGKILYDHDKDAEMRIRNQQEKARIISEMLESNEKGEGKPFFKKKKGHFHCNTIGEEASHEENKH